MGAGTEGDLTEPADSSDAGGADDGVGADDDGPDPDMAAQEERARRSIETLCGQLTRAADAHAVPHDFFIRLIWTESRFNPNALSPVGARGIAQFMPGTARARGLRDAFDPDQALPASAHFLRDLKDQFGVWGLAAAGYNAGPNRVLSYLAGRSGLPYETRNFVYGITGREAGYWKVRAVGLKRARSSPPADPAPDPLRSQAGATSPASTASGRLVAAKLATRAPLRPPLPAATEPGAVPRGAAREPPDITVHRPSEDTAPPATLGPSQVAGIVVHRPLDADAQTVPDEAAESPSPPAVAAGPFVLPRARPDVTPPPPDCKVLVAALGRAKTSPRLPLFATEGGSGWSPWGAQVAGHPRRDIAMRMFQRQRAKLPSDLGEPSVILRRFPARGRLPIHAVQFAASSRNEARATCARVARALVPCVVVKNR